MIRSGGLVEIPLTQGVTALIDERDSQIVSGYKWYAVRAPKTFYAKKTGGYLHRILLGDSCVGLFVDHINGNGLDNRRQNLRVADHRQNNRNHANSGYPEKTSRFAGVHFDTRLQRYRAQITLDRRRFHLGLFLDEVSAGVAYDLAAKRLFGEFAHLNFPDGVAK